MSQKKFQEELDAALAKRRSKRLEESSDDDDYDEDFDSDDESIASNDDLLKQYTVQNARNTKKFPLKNDSDDDALTFLKKSPRLDTSNKPMKQEIYTSDAFIDSLLKKSEISPQNSVTKLDNIQDTSKTLYGKAKSVKFPTGKSKRQSTAKLKNNNEEKVSDKKAEDEFIASLLAGPDSSQNIIATSTLSHDIATFGSKLDSAAETSFIKSNASVTATTLETSPAKGNSKAETSTQPSTADDLLSLFETVQVDGKHEQADVGPAKITVSLTEPTKTPIEQVVEKTTNQDNSKKTMINGLNDNIIDNVAQHNTEISFDMSDMYAKEPENEVIKKKKKTRKPGTYSFAHPPKGYSGLGSTTGLMKLQRKTSDDDLNSSQNIKEAVYLEWLEKAEKERKIKIKTESEIKNKEEETKLEKVKDKKIENESARRAWMERKEETNKEQQKRRRHLQRKAQEESLQNKEDKWKSAKKCEVMRKKMMEDAKKKHKLQVKKQREEEKLKENDEERKRAESQKALHEWNKQKQEKLKKEQRELKKIEKQAKRKETEDQEKAAEIAKSKYDEWWAKKASHSRSPRSRKSSSCYIEDEKPAWSPANKLVPFGR